MTARQRNELDLHIETTPLWLPATAPATSRADLINDVLPHCQGAAFDQEWLEGRTAPAIETAREPRLQRRMVCSGMLRRRLPSCVVMPHRLAWPLPSPSSRSPRWSSTTLPGDEALGDFFFGERYLSYFTSLDPRYLDFESEPYPPDRVPDLSGSPFRNRPWEYYPVANTLAAMSSALLSRGLGLLDPFDGYHALSLFLTPILLATLFVFVRRRFDRVAATAACLFLCTSLRLVAHLFSNIKDVPEMVFFSLALFAFVAAWERGSVRGILGAGLLWGLALGTKANALFLPPIIVVLVVGARQPAIWKGRQRLLWGSLVGSLLLGVALVFALWPYLWSAPIAGIRLHLEYIGQRLFDTRPESITSPLGSVALTTPVPFLVLTAVGIAICIGRLRARDHTDLLLLAWVGVVVGRLYLPNAVNFDGVRHFLEVFPAFATLAGIGSSWVYGKIRGSAALPSRARRLAAPAVVLLALAPGAAAVARLHPLELAYWNELAGGLGGARRKNIPQAGDYWGTSYRLGIDWLNQNAPAGTALAVPILEHAVQLVAPVRLRPDIGLLDISRHEGPDLRPDTFDILAALSRERSVYVMFVVRDDWKNPLIDDCLLYLQPLVRWTVDDEPVLLIYRWTPPEDSAP